MVSCVLSHLFINDPLISDNYIGSHDGTAIGISYGNTIGSII
jgi:hypothetical protein